MSGLTDAQARASDPGASVWVSASAGTGKTHVLTARVLRMMLGGVNPAKILCLTFTKAAAAEMANRIYEVLGRWTLADDQTLGADIQRRTGLTLDTLMAARARALFAEVLDLPGGLKIQTLHSFCQSLLGRFPVEADLPPGFDVLDDRTANEKLTAAGDLVLHAARGGEARDITSAIAHIATRVTENTFVELMSAVVHERAHIRRLMDHYETLEALDLAVRTALELPDTLTEDDVLTSACDAQDMDLAGLDDLARGLAQGGTTEVPRGRAMQAFLQADQADRPALFDGWVTAFLTKKGTPLARPLILATLKDNPARADVYSAEADRVLAIMDQRHRLEVATSTQALMRVATMLISLYGDEKRRDGRMDYEDLILQTVRLVTRDGIAPWVLYKMDEGLDHILIDEAQDTNPEQWAIVDALSEEFFAGNTARDVTRTVFAVGDAKQSIYRFQRADPEAFLKARDRAARRAAQVDLPFASVGLSLSFRSVPAVLRVVDDIFGPDHAGAGLTEDGERIVHEASRKGHGGLVELWPATEGPDQAPPDDWAPPVAQLRNVQAETLLAGRIARRIKRMLDEDEMLDARNRPIRPGDILILVRRRNRLVDDLVRALKSRGVPVAGSDRMVLTDDIAVMDLMALARFALLDTDDLTLATVLKSPLVGFDDDDLMQLAIGRRKATLWSRLRDLAGTDPRYARARAYLVRIRDNADFMVPYEFFSDILTADGGRLALARRLGTDINDPLDEFLNLALAFERENTVSLEGFLHWLQSGEAMIKRDLDTGLNEVRIMTVHGAKGLQAPIVFLPDTTQVPVNRARLLKLAPPDDRPDAPPLMIWPVAKEHETGPVALARAALAEAEDAEYRRLLYVALTRAEDRLYICGTVPHRGVAAASWYAIIEKAFHRLIGTIALVTDGQEIRRLQDPHTAPAPAPEPAAPTAADLPPPPANLAHPPAPEPHPPRPLVPSRPLDEDPPAMSPLGSDRHRVLYHRGTLIHALLEILPDLPVAARQQASSIWLAHKGHDLSAAEQADVLKSVTRILDDPQFRDVFGPGSRAEAAITGVIGGSVVSARVDRLLVTEDRVLVVDFKTNRPPPRDPGGVALAYRRQMAVYRDLLRVIYPDRPVDTALLWTETGQLMALDDSDLDAALGKVS